jgi:acyl-CoA synthetase (AMP-forming)/AMP-acid ligase II
VKSTYDARLHLREVLLSHKDKVLLRIAVSPRLDQPVELTGAAILERAEQLTSQHAIPGRSGVVLLLLPHSPELFLLQLGLVLKGYVPAVIAWPTSRIDPEKYQRNLLHQLRNLPADQLITLPRLAQNLSAGLPYRVTACASENAELYERLFPVAPVSESLQAEVKPASSTRPSPGTLFLQFSGGTTGAQKAIVVTEEMLRSQLSLLADCLQLSSEDSVVSWLPMYHDMGLIACLWFPLWHGVPSLHVGANDWIVDPELLIKYMSQFRGTLCWLPNFSFSYLAQRREQMNGPYDLSRVRAWINCSEPVRLRSMMSFAESFADWGVRPESLLASYALAENVFAVTQSELGKIPSTVARSMVHYGSRNYNDLAFDLIDDVFVSSGKPLADTEIRIVDGSGALCPDAKPGEIQIRTACLFAGYWGSEGFKTHSLSRDRFHATGDYGFTKDGELFVIGRIKDIVIIGGQNVFPEDVEAIVNSMDGIHPGRVVAFGIEDQEYGTERLVVIAEVRGEYNIEAAVELESELRKLVLAAIGIAPRYVAVVPQRWIVKSTAGKISRRDTRERFLQERLSKFQPEVV